MGKRKNIDTDLIQCEIDNIQYLSELIRVAKKKYIDMRRNYFEVCESINACCYFQSRTMSDSEIKQYSDSYLQYIKSYHAYLELKARSNSHVEMIKWLRTI